jgi:integrase
VRSTLPVSEVSKRRGHGEGGLYQRADGQWVGAVQLGWENGKRHRKVVYGKTQAEALGKLRTEQARVDAGLPLSDDRLTVADVMNEWLDNLQGHVSTNTLDNYATMARLHILPTLGRTRMRRLTPAAVQGLLASKQTAGYSPSTVRRIRAVLVQAIRQAERWGLVARNVAALTEGPRMTRREGRSLTVKQAQALLDAAKGDRLEALYLLMLSLGLRRGEALGLAWSDLDLDAGTLGVRRALKRERKRLVVGEVKTAGSRRTLNVPRPVVESLRTHRVRQLEERLVAGEGWTDSGLVFTTGIGTPIDPTNLRHHFDRLCERAGLGHWHPHELRHSAASIMLAQRVPLEVVSEVLGHASIRMTKDTYGHIMAPQKREAAEAMGQALWGG